ncbi:MAG: ribonuclease HII [Bacteroidetes bacterium]|nr:MAG: ribonuclease HII [Bacteroidota bacterium]
MADRATRKPRVPLVRYLEEGVEAGCDEAGRGCLAGPVCAAAVVLPPSFRHELVRDSKTLSEGQRVRARAIIEAEALAYRVVMVGPREIDALNILWASVRAMQLAVDGLPIRPDVLLVDGNRFEAMGSLPYECCVGGDGRYLSIAAASILAKTYRDEHMQALHAEYPEYGWDRNKGYPTKSHREAIARLGATPWHRLSFTLV